MYRGFSLKIDILDCSKIQEELYLMDSIEYDSNYVKNGSILNSELSIKNILIRNIVTNQSLDAEKIKGDWFPMIKSDVFISHSHRDLDIVKKLADILSQHLKLKVFVDSEIWKYSDELVERIESQCYESGRSLHDKIVAHVNIMLSSAITKMLDRTECVIFLNTSNSLIPTKYSSLKQTDSPWIYHELFITSILPVQSPNRQMHYSVVNEANEAHQLQILHTVPLEHLTNLSNKEFMYWAIMAKCCHCENSLDVLYNLKSLK